MWNVFFSTLPLHFFLLLFRGNYWNIRAISFVMFLFYGEGYLLSHPLHLFAKFSSAVITHVRMCASILYLSFAFFHLSALKIAANGWDMGIRYSENYVRYVPDKKTPQIPQAASAAVKCNPSTSGFVHRECLSNGIIFSRIDRWNTALSHFTIVTQCLF